MKISVIFMQITLNLQCKIMIYNFKNTLFLMIKLIYMIIKCIDYS